MKSTVKKKYDRQVNQDGSLTLNYKASRFGPRGVYLIGLGITVLWLFTGGILTIAVWDQMGAAAGIIFGAASYWFMLDLIVGKSKHSITLSSEGITFKKGKGFVAHKDITEHGVVTESLQTQHNYNKSHYVYADALGSRVNLSGFVEDPLAQALCNEVVNFRLPDTTERAAQLAA